MCLLGTVELLYEIAPQQVLGIAFFVQTAQVAQRLQMLVVTLLLDFVEDAVVDTHSQFKPTFFHL
jgi:hypothetical protein